MSRYQNELSVAKEAAFTAGKYLIENRSKKLGQVGKGSNKDFALTQDLESDKIIKSMIQESFPEDLVISEETSHDLKDTNSRIWIIDPIDGTRNYANGLHYFSISIALFENGSPVVGVVYTPVLDELYSAIESEGAFLNGERLQIGNLNSNLAESVVVTGFAYYKNGELHEQLEKYEKVLNRAVDVLRFGSGALDLCIVAADRLGAYYESGLKTWDLSAGVLILKESGGIVTDYRGNEIKFFVNGELNKNIKILACKNEEIKDEMAELLS